MKKTFTILIAAIAAILMMAQPVKVCATDITLTTSDVEITDFSAVGSSYLTSATNVNLGGYTWSVIYCMNKGKDSGVTYNNLQMRKKTNTQDPGSITSPTISSSNGFTVIVTYSSKSALTLQIGSETAQTGGTTSTNAVAGTGATVTAITTSTSTSFTLTAGTEVAYVSSIKIIPNHTIAYNATNGSIGGVVYGTTTAVASGAAIVQGGKVTLTAQPADGYQFSSWSDGGNNSTLSSTSTNPTTFTMGTANVTITATFVESGGATTYSVTYNENGATSGSVPTDDNSYEANDLVTVLGNTDNLAKTGNAFSGWCMNAGGTGTVYGPNNTTTFNITSNTTLYAKWTPYTITAASNNNSYGTVALNGNVITATPASGYGYASPAYTVSSGTATVVQNENEFTVTPTSDCTITINFEAISTHTATFSVNGTTTTQDFAEGATITFPADPADINGNKFVGWYGSTYSDPTTAPIFIDTEHETMGNSDKTYYAVFAAASESVETDELTTSTFGSPSSYTSWSGKQATNGSSAVYAGQTTGGTNYIQIRATSPSGIVTTTSGGKVAKVTVSWNSNTADDRTLDVYGKNSAYSDASDLYSNDATVQGTSLGSLYHNVKINNVTTTTTELTITGDYQFIGLRSKNGAMYLDEIDIQWTAVAYSDYNTTVVLPTVETPSFTVPEGTYNTEQSVKINCATTDATIYYTTNGDDPDANSIVYESGSNISITQTTTLKAIAIKDEDSSEIASATYTLKCATPQFDAPAGTYTADQTVAISTTTGSTIYYTTDNTDPTNESTEYTAALTIDATTTLKAIAYKSGWSPSDVATAQYNLPIVYANIAAFKEAYSSTSNELVKITGPLTTVYHNGKNLYVQDATGGMLVYDANAGTNNAIISRTYENGQTVSNIYGTYTKYNGLVEFIPYTDFPAPGTGTAVEPTDITTLSSSNYSTYESMLVRLTNATFAASTTYTSGSTGSNLNMTDGSSNTVVLRNGFQTLAGSITNGDKANVVGFATIYSKSGTTYQIFPRDNNDIQYILETEEIDYEKTIDFAAILESTEMIEITEDGILTIGGTFTNSGDENNILVEDGGQLICNNSVAATVYKTIEAWNTDNKTGWYLLSSPIHNAAISGDSPTISNLVTGSYDLFRYNESDNMWQIYKTPTPAFTSFEDGRGYLYRNAATQYVTFTGNTNTSVTYNLSYANEIDALKGFNIIGNPLTHDITWGDITKTNVNTVGYYTLGTDGNWTVHNSSGDLSTNKIAPMQGFLVQANGASPSVTFGAAGNNSESKANNDYIKFVVGNSQYNDVTYALFDKGDGINKIDHRNAEIPMLYIPRDGKNYAIATMGDDTQMFDLSFEAKTMGTYTISMNAKGNFSYIHLIDRLTGDDTNLLIEDYSFIGSPQDNAERFIVKLGYDNGSSTGSETFAYQSGNEIIVNGEGTLEVYDVTGRKVMTTTINGVETINGLNSGVYIFRVIGETLKTQKIVVR